MRLFSTDFRDLLVCVAGLYRNNGPVFRSLFFIFHFSFKNCYIGYTIVWTFLDFSFYQSDVKLKIRLVSYFIFLFFFFDTHVRNYFRNKMYHDRSEFFFFLISNSLFLPEKNIERISKKNEYFEHWKYTSCIYIYISFFMNFFYPREIFPEDSSVIR